MRVLTTENTKLAVVGTVCLAAGLVGPAAAAAFDANNADKVDGRHAVGAAASADQRAGKLVATDGRGRFPSSSIAPGFLTQGEGDGRYVRRSGPTFARADARFSVMYPTAGGMGWLAVRDDGDIRVQSDPNAAVTKIGVGQYCITAPGALEGAVGSLQNQGDETAGTIRVSMGIADVCNEVEDSDITVETFG